jgi:tRNA (cytidine/uridine-2'-O-)-methyltransferase
MAHPRVCLKEIGRIMIDIVSHQIELALLHPQIAPNTGSVARLCVVSGTRLHLVRPYGFVLNDRMARRAGLDYWPRLKLIEHENIEAFIGHTFAKAKWWFDSGGRRGLWQCGFSPGDVLCFGSETFGIDRSILSSNTDRVVRIPQVVDERCHNLANATSIALYEAIRQTTNAG